MNSKKCVNIIEELGVDALLILGESNMHYLCGFSPSEGVILLLKNGDCYHIVDSRYTETAENYAKETGLKVIEANSKMEEVVSKICKENGVSKIAFENESISLKDYNAYKTATGCEFVGMDDKFMRIRDVKSADEIVLMKKANAIAEKSFLELLNFVEAGKTEKELQAQFDYIMAKNGSDGVSFGTILLTGAHTSFPHGVPSDKVIQNGDFVLFDFGATYKGYHSDMTRTVAVGSATDEMKEMYDLVLRAQLAGIAALKAGVKCAEVYKASYDVLDEKNMAQYFRHGLGHCLGLEIHEGCRATAISKDTYQVGNVTSVEPGIYLPNKFGIRIEDVCVVTENGNENISTVPKELIIL